MKLLNVTDAKATKSEAIRKLVEPVGIRLNQVVAFGDDGPDLDMLSACGTSVCMANAIPELKALAKFETASNDEDGVAIVLEDMLKAISR
jgi:hydroxymethylpyrimidine pyrophosphatase-like HAD family hydrolase